MITPLTIPDSWSVWSKSTRPSGRRTRERTWSTGMLTFPFVPTPSNELREGTGFELREDGGKELRQ